MGITHELYNTLYEKSSDAHFDKLPLYNIITPDNVNDTDKWGQTLLHLAAARGHEDLVDFLLKHNANADVLDGAFDSPLKCAIDSTNTNSFNVQNNIVDNLLRHGAKIDEQEKVTLYTALHRAVFAGNLEQTQLLLMNGANLLALSLGGETPIRIAANSDKPEKLMIFDLLFEYYMKSANIDPALIRFRDEVKARWLQQERDGTSVRQLISNLSVRDSTDITEEPERSAEEDISANPYLNPPKI